MDALPSKDAAKLVALLGNYEVVGHGDPHPAKVQDYGAGILCIRHVKAAYQGGALFYVQESSAGFQKVCILTRYKKPRQEVPRNVLDRARIHSGWEHNWCATRGNHAFILVWDTDAAGNPMGTPEYFGGYKGSRMGRGTKLTARFGDYVSPSGAKG